MVRPDAMPARTRERRETETENPHEDEGFLALLRPIQDLTRNWEVDISKHLEDYINYIRQICGENIPDMNFAEAAVLLQNTANIYSKKVDFLFTTVMQLLDTLSRKQSEAKNKESQADEAGQQAGKRRKAVKILEIDEFLPFEDICSDRPQTMDLEKERKKLEERKIPKIVLNAAIKVKAKENTSCNVYNYAQEVMGKKEEFRLNWRMCSDGTLHEDFVISKRMFKPMHPIEIPLIPDPDIPPGDESHHNYDDHCSVNGDEVKEPDDCLPLEELLATEPAPIDRESIVGQIKQGTAHAKTVDVKEDEWQANDFNHNLPEKPIKKRRVVKIPAGLDDDRKRKQGSMLCFTTFTITDCFFEQYQNETYQRDLDFCYQSHEANKDKRHNANYLYKIYQEHYGIYSAPGVTSDGEDDNFNGFDGVERDDDDGDGFGEYENLEDGVPLPEKESILDAHSEKGWRGDDVNTYDNEAMRTIQAFRSRKIDHGRMTDMARRVEEWHQKITPKLEAAEQRSAFDIHAYGTKIIDAFSSEIGSVKPFADIVAGQPREEVARYFLSSLVLANQYNIEITESEPGELNTDCVQLKLLSVVRHHEELDDNLRQTSDK